MLTRLLLNLKRIHLAQGDYIRALAVVERLLVIAAGDVKEIRDRGLLLAHLGQSGAASRTSKATWPWHRRLPTSNRFAAVLAWIRRRAGGSA
jgi:regulator of sirC expression with transglutaminase-like and TPR domain